VVSKVQMMGAGTRWVQSTSACWQLVLVVVVGGRTSRWGYSSALSVERERTFYGSAPHQRFDNIVSVIDLPDTHVVLHTAITRFIMRSTPVNNSTSEKDDYASEVGSNSDGNSK
jgi:hypothetical protein